MGCGIAGFVGLSDKQLLKSMCEAIRHRGPDDTDYFLDGNVGLGIDRLKIIDLATGDQPIHNEDGSVWLVFNGEIYNYPELKVELERLGHQFYTSSDTETIVHAYEIWGVNCVEHLRGMFAFAIWDARAKRLFLARDRFGKKPLYYALKDGVLLFASELKAILRYDGIERTIDHDAIDYYFTYMYIPSPLSIFKDIRKLPPGSYGVFESGELTIKEYWDFEPRPDASLHEDKIIDALYETMLGAVKLRMRSDVPLGAFLSGGIDSSTVVAMMGRLSDQPVKTVSIGFTDGESETGYARQVADFLKTDHREYIVTPDAYRILPKLLWHFDEPFADHSMIPTYYLSEVTRAEVTVALSGDGGDELFMGYPFLLDPSSYAVYSQVPNVLKKPIMRALAGLPVDTQVRRMAKHAHEKEYGGKSRADRYAMRVSVHNPAGLRKLYSRGHLEEHGPVDTYSYLQRLVEHCPSKDPMDALDYATVRSYLEEDILVKVDRMTMAVSLEARCPLLDQELAALIERIPSKLKMRGRETKYIFKKMVVKKGLIPRSIAVRKKRGFGAPIESWLKGHWKDMLSQVLDPVITKNYTGLFDGAKVKALAADPYVNSNKLFALITFISWYKLYADGDVAKAPPTEAEMVL